jgi:hypothetical protein
MTVLATLRNYYGAFERRRNYARTERMIRHLPPEVLKDIGWPGADEGVEGALRGFRSTARH